MCIEIADFAQSKERKADLRKRSSGGQEITDGRRARRQCRCLSEGAWRIGPVSNVQTSQKPVMSTILEDVCPWHGARTESVDEDCLEFALDEV